MLGLILLSTVPITQTLEVHCDFQEVNRVVDQCGNETLAQWIAHDVGEIRDWRMLARTGYPQYDWQTGNYVTRWVEGGRIVEVKSPAFRETVSSYDPEILAREWLPECHRRRINR